MHGAKPAVVQVHALAQIARPVRSVVVVDKLTTIKGSSHLRVRVLDAAVREARLKLHVVFVVEPELKNEIAKSRCECLRVYLTDHVFV
jgi:hypothetical protein